MKQDPLIPVEPLSERRWQEVRKVVLDRARDLSVAADRSDAPSRPSMLRRAAPLAAVVAVAAAAMLAFTHLEGAQVAATSRVVTEGAPASASAGDVTLELDAHTSVLVVQLAAEQWLVSVEHGSVRFLVPPRGGRPAFSVEAGRTRVVVIGTTFTVSREPGAASGAVEVEHGTVRVEDLAEQYVLHDGDRWPQLAAERASDDDVVSAESPAPVAPPTADTHAEARSEVVRTTRAARPTASSAIATPTEPTPPSEAQAPPDGEASAPSVPAERSLVTPPSASDRYREAESIEPRDPARARAIYESLVAEGGSWSAPALMAEARLAYEEHDEAAARALCRRYLAEHPDGINAEDARALLERMP